MSPWLALHHIEDPVGCDIRSVGPSRGADLLALSTISSDARNRRCSLERLTRVRRVLPQTGRGLICVGNLSSSMTRILARPFRHTDGTR